MKHNEPNPKKKQAVHWYHTGSYGVMSYLCRI
jgi:hypothetical protein